MKQTDAILAQRLLPVVTINSVDAALPLAETLLEAGCKVIEVTLRTAAGMESIRQIMARFPELAVGAGPVLNNRQVHELQDLDVRFLMTPGLNEAVIGAARERDHRDLRRRHHNRPKSNRPGASGSSISSSSRPRPQAARPCSARSCWAYQHTDLRIIPTGGISPETAPGYLSIPGVVAVGGNWFVKPELIDARNWAEINARPRKPSS
jgi:2-dehydro-3-deoxyphosphogluconate aldolase/(4S)-4-hydroxy-2-oxoglutarate aldolase